MSISISISDDYSAMDDLSVSNLSQATTDRDYIIKKVLPIDQELVDFLFSLGCFQGERITLVSVLSDCYVVSINGARYSLSRELAELIQI